jgi:hypothetical protein
VKDWIRIVLWIFSAALWSVIIADHRAQSARDYAWLRLEKASDVHDSDGVTCALVALRNGRNPSDKWWNSCIEYVQLQHGRLNI